MENNLATILCHEKCQWLTERDKGWNCNLSKILILKVYGRMILKQQSNVTSDKNDPQTTKLKNVRQKKFPTIDIDISNLQILQFQLRGLDINALMLDVN